MTWALYACGAVLLAGLAVIDFGRGRRWQGWYWVFASGAHGGAAAYFFLKQVG